MKAVKTFFQHLYDDAQYKLEESINKWIKSKGDSIEIEDIKYQMSQSESCIYHSALVIYEILDFGNDDGGVAL